MKSSTRLVASLVGIFLSGLLAACSSPTSSGGSAAITRIAPVIAFGTNTARSVISESMTPPDAVYYLFCPALTGFVQKDEGIAEGQTLSPQAFLDTTVAFTVTSFSAGTNGIDTGVRFTGNLADGSGTIVIEIDNAQTKIWYEEKLFVYDPQTIVSSQSASKSILYQTVSGTVDSNLSIYGTADMSFFLIRDNGTYAMSNVPKTEFYAGAWNDAAPDVTGAGIAFLQLRAPLSVEGTYGTTNRPSATYANFGAQDLAASIAFIQAYKATEPELSSQNTVIYKTSGDEHATMQAMNGWSGVTDADTAKANLPSARWSAISKLDTYDY